MSDEELENELAHFGKKGMKWGVRNEKRLEKARAIGYGSPTHRETMKWGVRNTSAGTRHTHGQATFGMGLTAKDRARTDRAIQSAARAQAKRLDIAKKRIARGEATAGDILIKHGMDRPFPRSYKN